MSLPRPLIRRIAVGAANAFEDLRIAARLGRDLPDYLRQPTSLHEAEQHVRHQLATRETRFLKIIERAVYGQPNSPYAALLAAAGCEPGDVRALVAREGLEGALSVLADRGVYLTHAEAKGFAPVVRGSLRFDVGPRALDSHLLPAHMVLLTGGSGRRPSRVRYPLAYFHEMGETVAITLAAHGVARPRAAFWWPAPTWLMMMFASVGIRSHVWFYPAQPLPWQARMTAAYVRTIARSVGVTLPTPEFCGIAEPARLVQRLAAELQNGPGLVLWVTASAGTRVALAALEQGVSLDGLAMVVSSEPVTSARRDAIRHAGAQVIAGYGSVDVTAPAYACAASEEPDDLHAMTHRFAAITRPTPTVGGGPNVDALLISSITETAPRIALNLMIGDYARLEERDCACALGALGLRTHLSNIGSHEKLTSEGVTFARTNLQHILEQVLPARFGGTLLDYQLTEELAPDGVARLILRASPAIGPLDEAALRAVLLNELGQDSLIGSYQARMWQQAGTVEVRRESPHLTAAGKVLPFQRLRQDDATSAGPVSPAPGRRPQ